MSIGTVILTIVKQQVQLEERLTTALDTEIAKYKDTCPPREVILRTIEIKNNINTGLQNILGAIKSTETTETATNAILTGSQILINLALALPIPNQATTVGITNTFASRLIDLKNAIRTGRALASSLSAIIDTLQGIAISIQSKLGILDQLILKCAGDQGISFTAINTTVNNLTEQSTQAVYDSTVTYKGYTLTVQISQENFGSLKKRFGQATTSTGVIQFRTQETFATDTTIILEELKFLIDNQV